MSDAAHDRLPLDLSQPLPHPSGSELHGYTEQVVDWLLEEFRTLPEQPIGQTETPAALAALLNEPPPRSGSDFTKVFAEYREKVAPYALRIGHPRFWAFVPGAPTFFSVLGEMLCAGANNFAGVWLEASGAAQVELLVLDWFREFLDMPAGTQGILTSGGSEANLTALVAAREPLTYDDRARAMVYVGDQRHSSIDRALRIMGFRANQLRVLPSDADFRLQPTILEEMVHFDRAEGRFPWLVVANAGATNTGAVDPLAVLARLCGKLQLWLHVDAAYGWSAVLTPEGKTCLRGIGEAHSVTLDPHKWFGQTFEAGCLLVRQGHLLSEAFAMRPDYLQDAEPIVDAVNFADRGLALTRRFRALKIWLSIKVLGIDWYRDLVARNMMLANLSQTMLESEPDFEILSPRRLSIVCFRYRPLSLATGTAADGEKLDRLNGKLCGALRASGRVFISSTRLRGRTALRFCFVNWRTTSADVEEVIHLLAKLARELS